MQSRVYLIALLEGLPAVGVGLLEQGAVVTDGKDLHKEKLSEHDIQTTDTCLGKQETQCCSWHR